jgi:hypothetical protein
MTKNEIIFSALTSYFNDLSNENEMHNLETIDKLDTLINTLKNDKNA